MTGDMEQIIPAGYCLNCRYCCRFSHDRGPWLPYLLADEKKALGDCGVVPCLPGESFPYRCRHLVPGSNSCGVYGSRPFECRLYPFLLNTRDSRRFLSVDDNCPFVAEHGKDEEFMAYAIRLRHWLMTECRELLRREPAIFQAYPECRDIAELEV